MTAASKSSDRKTVYPSRGRRHDSNMKGMMVIFFFNMLTKRIKKHTIAYIEKIGPMNSITVKMKMLVKWLGPGMAQG